MEVVKEEKIIKCWNCNTNLKYTPEDIETTWLCKSPFIRCPICNSKIFNLDNQILKLKLKYVIK
jgi:DNA-directed RNA polymerase subunit RPC12/RpoP